MMATAQAVRTTKKRAASKRSTRSAKTVEAKGMTPTHDEIAMKAYEIWIANDCRNGRDLENWYEAETQLALGI